MIFICVMEVRFRRSYLRRCAQSVALATRRWGPVVGNLYIRRIEVINRTKTFHELFDLVYADFHPLKGDRGGEFAIRLHGRWRLIVEPTEDSSTILIKEVTNHYGD